MDDPLPATAGGRVIPKPLAVDVESAWSLLSAFEMDYLTMTLLVLDTVPVILIKPARALARIDMQSEWLRRLP